MSKRGINRKEEARQEEWRQENELWTLSDNANPANSLKSKQQSPAMELPPEKATEHPMPRRRKTKEPAIREFTMKMKKRKED